LRWASDSSIIFAMKMVHVTSEANARPIITALTSTSADRNIDQGDNSRRPAAAVFRGLAPSTGAIASAAGPWVGWTTTGGAGAAGAGAACAVGA